MLTEEHAGSVPVVDWKIGTEIADVHDFTASKTNRAEIGSAPWIDDDAKQNEK